MNDVTHATSLERDDGLPVWIDRDKLAASVPGGQLDVDFRREYGPIGRWLVEALARWTHAMMPVSELDEIDIDDQTLRPALDRFLGYADIDYVLMFACEINHAWDKRKDPAEIAKWKAAHPGVFDDDHVIDHPGLFDLALRLPEGVEYAEWVVTQAGGTVTWPEGKAR